MAYLALLAWLSLLQIATADLNNDTSPTSIFRSRPDLHAPIIDMQILRPSLVTPGYIFLAPYRNRDPGPYIYDNYGDLIWSGAGESGPKTAHAPHVCNYNDEPHLCYFEGEQHQGFARGHGTILDKHYRVVKTVESTGAGASSDMHEFRLTPFSNGTTALSTVYQPRMYDLSTNPNFRIQGGMGWLVEGVFQEIELDTGRVVFEWRSTDHIDPSLSHVYPGTTDTSGDGLTEDTPWDYFHINSIDKNEDGDYLICARHTSAIYKISGVDGHIIWQMGGEDSTFEQTNFRFSSQHHARWLKENATHTLLSFFDNASNTFHISDSASLGYIISINHVNKSATAARYWGAPEPDGLLSGSQGNMQLLPGLNVHIGWGENACFTEHTWAGDAVQYGKLAMRESNVMIYRSYKFNWTGLPLTKPSLWTYAREPESEQGMALYVSWNGATEVASWNFYVANSSSGPFGLIGNARKRGFETSFRADHYGWAFAEALDKDGVALERSQIARTFVPGPKLRPFCDATACTRAQHVEDEEFDSVAAEAYKAGVGRLSPDRGFNTSHYYAGLPDVTFRLRQFGLDKLDVGSLVLGVAGSAALLVLGAVLVGCLALALRPRWRPAFCFPGRVGWNLSKGTAALGRYAYRRLSGEAEKEDDVELPR